MGLNDTPSGERLHIGFFGCRNAGKSSVVNAVTGQNLAIVSETKGTTTDPVYKAMELLPLGPVMIIDTPGFDDTGKLGELRVKKTRHVLNKTDIAVVIVDSTVGLRPVDEEIIALIEAKKIPYLLVWNKTDLQAPHLGGERELAVSAATGAGIWELKERLGATVSNSERVPIVADLIKPHDLVLLVVPIDSAAPKGRLILPQQQTIREVLDSDAVVVVVKENEVAATLTRLGTAPALVITDSQAFQTVAAQTPDSILLTSFSILMARHKGLLASAVRGVTAVETLHDHSKVLIAEGCTHHRQCDDIGTVKIPRWLQRHTGAAITFETASGTEFPDDLSPYELIIHCGSCMLNEREVQYRMKCAADQGVAMTNYGIFIAYVTGILKRSVRVFPDVYKTL